MGSPQPTNSEYVQPARPRGRTVFLNAVTIQYVKEVRDTNILTNAACPGFTATDLNGFRGVRTPEQGAAIAIRLAILPDDGPTGGFFDDAGAVPRTQPHAGSAIRLPQPPLAARPAQRRPQPPGGALAGTRWLG